MQIEIVTIGDELLLGYTIDTNAAHLARTLAADRRGDRRVARRSATTRRAIAAAVREALDRTGAVITTGGLGPTSDDLTQAFDRGAVRSRACMLDEEHLAWMEERCTRLFQRPMPAANRQQAMLPDGAREADEQSWLGARASGSRTNAGAGSRCCPACRARCAACSPTRSSR